MAELFLALSPGDQREALLVASGRIGRPAYLLEKDVWVVWVLRALFAQPFGEHLVFKGGTSLSKAYGDIINRFSEDIDLTYDIRQLIPDKTGDGREPLPANRSQEKKWTSAVREELPRWITENVLPALENALSADRLEATLEQNGDKVVLTYSQVTEGGDYVEPRVVLEFGARSTGEPASEIGVVCDAAAVLTDLVFPDATPRVMAAERTFWEKATAAHVYCLQQKLQPRYARHWHDLVRLDAAGIADKAIVDRPLAEQVAAHKQSFFLAKDAGGGDIAYSEAIGGSLRLVPDGDALANLADDYQKMINGGLLDGAPIDFDQLVAACREIEAKVNRAAK